MSAAEEWRPVAGWECYEVSNLGRVRSVARVVIRRNGAPQTVPAKVLAAPLNHRGRPGLRLKRPGEGKTVLVQSLVLEAFVGPRPAGLDACHNDGDKTNNRLSNLRWDTRSSNTVDQVEHGVHAQARKTHCPKGHPYSGDNLDRYVRRQGHVQRRCRACRSVSEKRSREARRAA